MRKIIHWKKGEKLSFTSIDKIVLVGGCFDVLHYGHVVFLKKAKERGAHLVIALESDEFIQVRKKRVPIHTQNQRAEILAELSVVDVVVCMPFLSSDSEYDEMVQSIRPSIIAITKGDRQIENKKKQAAKVGAELEVVVDKIDQFSTTHILNYATVSRD